MPSPYTKLSQTILSLLLLALLRATLMIASRQAFAILQERNSGWKTPLYDRIPTDRYPDWLMSYIQFHKGSLEAQADLFETNSSASPRYRLRANNEDVRFLSWRCGREDTWCGGLGDRIRGIVFSFYIALCNERVFLIDDHAADPKLVNFITPRPDTDPISIQWKVDATEHMRKHQTKLIAEYTGENYKLENLISLPSGNIVLKTNKQPWWTEEGGINRTIPMFEKLRLATDAYVRDRAFGLAFWTLFQWSDRVIKMADELLEKAKLTTTRASDNRLFGLSYVGVHMRIGKGGDIRWKDPIRHAGETNLRKFYNCTQLLRQEIQTRCKHDSQLPVYLASDDPKSRRDIAQWDTTGSMRFSSYLQPFHVDKRNHENETTILQKHTETWAELKILTEAVCLVTSRSGFSRLAQELRLDQPTRCSVRFNQCTPAAVQTAVSVLTKEDCETMIRP